MRTEHTPKNHRIKDFSKEPRASARGIIGGGCVLGAAAPKPLLAIHPRASARGILADFVKRRGEFPQCDSCSLPNSIHRQQTL